MSGTKRLKSLWGRKEPQPKKAADAAAIRPQFASPPEPRDRATEISLPRFQTTAGDQVDRQRPNARARERVGLRTSFGPSQPVADPQMFAGRRDVLARMIQAIEDQRSHVIIYGERGVGKTSLLHMLAHAAKEARYIVVYFSCGATSDFSETFRTAASEIPLLYHSGTSPTAVESGSANTLADLIDAGRLTPRAFADVAAKLVGTRVLIMLDEFDRTESAEFRRDTAELMKTLSDTAARVQIVVAGATADLAGLIGHAPSIRRSVAGIPIPALSDDEVRELIMAGARNSGMDFATDAVALATLAARGSPYLTRLLCHTAGMRALDAGRTTVTAVDMSQALERSIADLADRLPAEVVRHLGLAEQTASAANRSAAGPSANAAAGSAAFDIATLSRMGPEGILARLRKDGVLQNDNQGAYTLILDALAPCLQLIRAREASKPTPV